jgi:hypothetical protein
MLLLNSNQELAGFSIYFQADHLIFLKTFLYKLYTKFQRHHRVLPRKCSSLFVTIMTVGAQAQRLRLPFGHCHRFRVHSLLKCDRYTSMKISYKEARFTLDLEGLLSCCMIKRPVFISLFKSIPVLIFIPCNR